MLQISMVLVLWDFLCFAGKDGDNVALLLLLLPKPHFFATIATPILHTRGLCIEDMGTSKTSICDIFSTKNNTCF